MRKKIPRLRIPQKTPGSDAPVHRWRVCPYGEHQVITHQRHNPPSKTHPDGSISTVHWHCAKNPSHKDQLYPDEIREIAKQHFSSAKNKPCPLSLGFENGSKYDDLIAGWVQYWNEVLKPDQPLSPNLVKALIASESGFDPSLLNNKKNSNSARGLMQITNETRKLLNNPKELKDHYLDVTKEDLNDPAVNICAGVRWLFRKKEIASVVRLKRPANWLEAAEEYKGDLEGLLNNNSKSKKDVESFLNYLKEVEECGK
jgi:Transglycosylase SLT domain